MSGENKIKETEHDEEWEYWKGFRITIWIVMVILALITALAFYLSFYG